MTQQPVPPTDSAPLSRRAALRCMTAGGLALGADMVLGRPAMAQLSPDSSLTEAAARHAIDIVNQVLSSGELHRLEEAFSPGYVTHTPHRSGITGRLLRPDLAGLMEGLRELNAAVPDAVLIVEEVIAADDRAAIRLRFQGTLTLATEGATPAANQHLDLGTAVFARVLDGLVSESWDYAEPAELLGANAIFDPAVTPAAAGAATAEMPAAEPSVAAGRGEVRAVKDFEAVSLDGVGLLVMTQGDTESLTIEAEPHVLERIETVVEAGVLSIRPVDSFETNQPILYHLSLIQLNRLAVAGAGQAQMEDITADDLSLELSGSAVVAIEGLDVGTLDVVAEGSAEIELAGLVDQQTVLLRAASQYSAARLASRLAAVTVEAAAQATVAVSEQLEATVSDAGSIGYLGDPVVSQAVSGAGSLTRVE